ncbi:hypothetical protein M378DRAFT_156414 [Amanita muscaria Koide BX008]|uniref:Uncharacterized protein n=1 Tax=Amanita muscaria (strain Koide BX008) TaxID=946122 RepID=A0A0C2TSN6_AMAMK|nr:hypothetical protein M378DRAFT_156414 [Amanita muscaria Koide BX008]
MGQWTLDHLDNVLHAKITTLVSGAIQRVVLEKSEPSITYENFVKDLDTGDSFTTTFIDILVKEMAERRMRPNDSDRRLIADRTAKSLRVLASELRTYRDRPSRNFPRRPVNLSDYLSAPPNEMDVEDDDEDFDPVFDSFPEGARINQDLFDAYGLWPTRRIFSSSPSPPAEENAASVRPPSTTHHNPWVLSSSSSSTNLRRQSSIRHSSRSRAVDFNDFTSRRRTSTREALSSRSEGNDGSGEQRERDSAVRNSRLSTRRFFPVGRTRTHDSASAEGIETRNGDASDEGHTFVYEPSVSGGAAWFPVLSPARSASPVADSHDSGRRNQDASEERARTLVHRLRRGGVRAPESIFSPYQEPPSLSSLPSSNNRDDAREAENAATSYPTPGSTENGSSS